MRNAIISYFRSLSAGTIAVMTGETKYSVVDAILASAVEYLLSAPEIVLKGLSEDGERVRWDLVSKVLNDAKMRIAGVITCII